jgi:hypothetical protein
MSCPGGEPKARGSSPRVSKGLFGAIEGKPSLTVGLLPQLRLSCTSHESPRACRAPVMDLWREAVARA